MRLCSKKIENRIVITPPSGMTVEQFDEMVIKTGNSFGNNPNITYCLEPFEQTQGNCNSSSSTLLYKAGVPLSWIKDLRKQISCLRLLDEIKRLLYPKITDINFNLSK